MGIGTKPVRTKKTSKMSKMLQAQEKSGSYDNDQKLGGQQTNPQLDQLEQKMDQIQELQNTLGNESMARLLMQGDTGYQEDLDRLENISQQVASTIGGGDTGDLSKQPQMEQQPGVPAPGERLPQESEEEQKKQENQMVSQISQEADGALEELQQEKAQASLLQASSHGQTQNSTGQGSSQAQQGDDLTQLLNANAGQSTVRNTSFAPVSKKRGKFLRFLHGFGHCIYKGWTMLTTPVGWVLGKLFVRPFGKRTLPKQEDLKGTIPGFGNRARFEQYDIDSRGDDQEIQDDVRRVPLVWEQRIPEDPEQAPKIRLMVEQPKEGSAKSVYKLNLGHAMVCLFYSRMDRLTGKKERYRVQYGFYPKGGFTSPTSIYSLLKRGMTVPGQVLDDAMHPYSIAQTYDVNNKQINQVLAMSENYAEGGYSYFDRNCTTFARDVSRTAGLDVGNIFEETDVNFDGGWKMNLLLSGGFLAGGLVDTIINEGALNHMYNKSKKDDLSYAGFGRKMVSQKDMDNADAGFSVEKRMYGLAPGITGENMRNSDQVEIGALGYMPEIKKEPEKKKPETGKEKKKENTIRRDLVAERQNLMAALKTKGVSDLNLGYLQDQMEEMEKRVISRYFDVQDAQGLAPGVIRECNQYINTYLQFLNDTFRNQFNGDVQLNIPFQHMAAVLQNYQEEIYDHYEKSVRYADETRDVSSYLNDFYTKASLSIDMPDNKPQNANLTVADQAGIIQMFGSLTEGRQFMEELAVLDGKEKRTKTEEHRYKQLKMKAITLNSFVRAQQSYVNRKNFTQSDMDLAFIYLEKGEEGAKNMQDHSMASQVYQGLAYEKVFGGLKGAFQGWKQEAGIQNDTQITEDQNTYDAACGWISKYLSDKVQTNHDTMQMIVNSYCQQSAMKKMEPEDIMMEIMESISTVYIRKVIDLFVPLAGIYYDANKEQHPIGGFARALEQMIVNYRTRSQEALSA